MHELGRRLRALRAEVRRLARWMAAAPHAESCVAGDRKEAPQARMPGGSSEAGWDGRGHARIRWPTEGGRVRSGPSDVLDSLARRLTALYGEAAPGAVGPVELWRKVDDALKHEPDDGRPLLEPDAWDAALQKACRGPAAGWHTGAEGLGLLSPALSDRLRRAFSNWAEAPGSTLPVGWLEAHAFVLPKGQSRVLARHSPIVPPNPAVGVATRSLLKQRAQALHPRNLLAESFVEGGDGEMHVLTDRLLAEWRSEWGEPLWQGPP